MKFLLLLGFLSVASCSPSPKPTPTACSAESNWITNPSMPSEVASKESFCDFYQFSWQWFLAQMSPSDSQSGEPTLFQNRVYQPNGGTNQCANQPLTGLLGATQALLPR